MALYLELRVLPAPAVVLQLHVDVLDVPVGDGSLHRLDQVQLLRVPLHLVDVLQKIFYNQKNILEPEKYFKIRKIF